MQMWSVGLSVWHITVSLKGSGFLRVPKVFLGSLRVGLAGSLRGSPRGDLGEVSGRVSWGVGVLHAES